MRSLGLVGAVGGLTTLSLLCGCGTQVPKLEVLGTEDSAAFAVNLVANQVNCELRKAVYYAVDTWRGKPQSLDWLKTWTAKVTYKIVVDEKGVLNPGLSLNTVYPNASTIFTGKSTVSTPQSFALGLGGQFSSDATRTESIGFFFSFADFFPEPDAPTVSKCKSGEGTFIESDLRLREWMNAVALTAATPDTIYHPDNGGAPFDVISHEVQFVVVAGANVTPTWKLVQVTANPTAPFVGATRQRTDDVLITMGQAAPPLKAGAKATAPSTAVENAHLAAQIGQAVASAIQSQQP